MSGGGLGAGRRRYRRGQSAVLFGLATLVIVACAIGPLFERAVEQATVRATLSSAPRTSRGLVVGIDQHTTAQQIAPGGAARRLLGQAVRGVEIPAGYLDRRPALSTTLAYRDDQCRHLTFLRGRCPSGGDEVVASAPAATALHLRVGSRVHLSVPLGAASNASSTVTPTVVGLYRPFSAGNDYWFGARYSSRAGITVSSDGVEVDAFLGSESFVLATTRRLGDLGVGAYVRTFVDVPLLPDRVGVGDLAALRGALAVLQADQVAGHPVQLTSALPQYLDEIDAGRRGARQVVVPSALALALLAALAFGVVAAAAAEQRRPELALARLRGNSVPRSAGVFVRELGVLALAAAVPGVLLAWVLALTACRVWLPSGVRPEIRPPVLGAVIGALALLVAVVAVIGVRASGQPITDMLRQLPGRTSRLRVGIVEAVVVVAALAALVASVGGRRNPLAALSPTFVALLVGLLASRVLVMAARGAGGRALGRGALVRALAALSIARRPGGRLTVTVLCVATALLTFAAQQWSVARANRAQRSAAETGAAVVLSVNAPDVNRLIAAVHAADTTARFATPVVVVDPPGINAVPTVAVDPSAFGVIASWGRPALRPAAAVLAHLVPRHTAPPLIFTGNTLRLQLGRSAFTVLGRRPPGAGRQSVSVRVDLLRADGQAVSATFGPLPARGMRPSSFGAAAPCADGCHVTGIETVRPATDELAVAVDFTVTGLVGGVPLSPGHAADWAPTTVPTQVPPTGVDTSMTATDSTSGVRFRALDDGSGTSMQYLEQPLASPALLAGPAPATKDPLGYLTGATLNGGTGRVSIVGTLPFVPQIGAALVVDLQVAARAGPRLDATAHPQVWLRAGDPGREERLVTILRAAGITVVQRSSTAQLGGRYAHSAPGWSASFALVVGGLAELIAVALLALVVLTSRRGRQADLAAMRLSGVRVATLQRATVSELLVFVLVGVGAGAVAGLIGVRLSLSSIPIFTGPAAVPLPVSFVLQWPELVGALLVSGVLLAPVAVSMGARLAAGATAGRALGDIG